MISVIIPAHNEESVIARGLRAIVDGAAPGELEVIVACNGCTDRTAEIAASFGPPVRVLDVPVASKIAALNAADAAASGFPRFYIDADVVLDLASIRRMAAELERGDVLMATPELSMDLSRTTWAVRSFYRVWTALPYNREGGAVGTGVYAVSRAGRARWAEFPEVTADDGFVRFCFEPHERTTVAGAASHVDPPKSLAGLIRIKTRSRRGQHELAQRYAGRTFSDRTRSGGGLAGLLGRPSLWSALPVYVWVTLVTRRRARRAGSSGTGAAWERDDSRGSALGEAR